MPRRGIFMRVELGSLNGCFRHSGRGVSERTVERSRTGFCCESRMTCTMMLSSNAFGFLIRTKDIALTESSISWKNTESDGSCPWEKSESRKRENSNVCFIWGDIYVLRITKSANNPVAPVSFTGKVWKNHFIHEPPQNYTRVNSKLYTSKLHFTHE